jgi:exopolyphosphatase/guanosine-5'-triphosphate,3'-diphosphate pyrophosphatase
MIRQALPRRRNVHLVALGSEARFAAAQLVPDWDQGAIARIPVASFRRLTGKVERSTPEELVRKYHLSFAEADTLAPALYFNQRLARALNAKQIMVPGVSMRNGVLMEMARRDMWATTFRDQILKPARQVGRKYGVDEPHVEHVAALCGQLFQALREEHKLGPWHELLLTVAALLHDIGHYVSERNHHKHAMYLIQNSELFGLNRRDILLVAQVARYHRRANPKPSHEGFAQLSRGDRVVVAKLAAILRVADALDRSNSQRVRSITCIREEQSLVIEVAPVTNISLEALALRGKGSMFEDVYGVPVTLRTRADTATRS